MSKYPGGALLQAFEIERGASVPIYRQLDAALAQRHGHVVLKGEECFAYFKQEVRVQKFLKIIS